MTIEKSRIEKDIFVDEQYLIIRKVDIDTDTIGERLHYLIGTSSRENDGDFFIDASIAVVAIF